MIQKRVNVANGVRISLKTALLIVTSLFLGSIWMLIGLTVLLDNIIGPSGVRALPFAAGRNEGGHYFR